MWRKKGPKAPTASVDRDMWTSSGYRRPAGGLLDGGTWIKGWMDGRDIGETKALSRSTLSGVDDVDSGPYADAPCCWSRSGKHRTERQKPITWTYLVSLETGLSFDLQSTGDSCCAAETIKDKQNVIGCIDKHQRGKLDFVCIWK